MSIMIICSNKLCIRFDLVLIYMQLLLGHEPFMEPYADAEGGCRRFAFLFCIGHQCPVEWPCRYCICHHILHMDRSGYNLEVNADASRIFINLLICAVLLAVDVW